MTVRTAPSTIAPTLKISLDAAAREVVLEVLRPERLAHRGLGTFLEADPREILITYAALWKLSECPCRPGRQDFVLFPHRVLMWSGTDRIMRIPLSHVSRHPTSCAWLRQCVVLVDDD